VADQINEYFKGLREKADDPIWLFFHNGANCIPADAMHTGTELPAYSSRSWSHLALSPPDTQASSSTRWCSNLS
jgi:hypothetical protein